MATSSQVLANRENSKLSTGPKTEEVKKTSSSNAITHGFSAADPVLPAEDRNQFNQLLQDLKSEFQPATAHQEFLVNQMVGAQWKLNRLERMENQMFASLDDPAKAFTDEETARKFAGLQRYRVALERTYHRSIKELRIAKREQKEAKSRQLAEKSLSEAMRRRAERGGPAMNFLPTRSTTEKDKPQQTNGR